MRLLQSAGSMAYNCYRSNQYATWIEVYSDKRFTVRLPRLCCRKPLKGEQSRSTLTAVSALTSHWTVRSPPCSSYTSYVIARRQSNGVYRCINPRTISTEPSTRLYRSTRSMTRSLMNFTFSTGILTVYVLMCIRAVLPDLTLALSIYRLTSCGLFISVRETELMISSNV